MAQKAYNCIDDKKRETFTMFSKEGISRIDYRDLCSIIEPRGKVTFHDRETCLALIKDLKMSVCLTNTEKN